MYSKEDIIKALNGKIEYQLAGNTDLTFLSIEPLNIASNNTLTWIRSNQPTDINTIRNSVASVIICSNTLDISGIDLKNKCLVQVDQPGIAFLRIVKSIYQRTTPSVRSIHPTAIISKNAKIGNNVSIGAYSIIEDCEIGDNSTIECYVKIHSDVIIGKNSLIAEYCNIGGQGFGHIVNENGVNENMLHIGKVIIEDNVEIFPYSNVDKATLSATIIRENVKIDHYCHIGHNSEIGANSIITAKTVLCGGSKVGSNSWLGVSSVIKDKIIVGNNVTIGMGSMVTKDVPDDATWVGNPARPIEEFKGIQKAIKKII